MRIAWLTILGALMAMGLFAASAPAAAQPALGTRVSADAEDQDACSRADSLDCSSMSDGDHRLIRG